MGTIKNILRTMQRVLSDAKSNTTLSFFLASTGQHRNPVCYILRTECVCLVPLLRGLSGVRRMPCQIGEVLTRIGQR